MNFTQQSYPIKNCKYPIHFTFYGKYPIPQKKHIFPWVNTSGQGLNACKGGLNSGTLYCIEMEWQMLV